MLCGHFALWSCLFSSEGRGRRDLGLGAFERENTLNHEGHSELIAPPLRRRRSLLGAVTMKGGVVQWSSYVAYFFGGVFLVNSIPHLTIRASAPDTFRFPARQGTVFANGQRALWFRESCGRVFACVPGRRFPSPSHFRCARFGSRRSADGGHAVPIVCVSTTVGGRS
jgi:hypothetical protein